MREPHDPETPSPEERRWLEAWPAREAPPDLAEQVLARATRPSGRSRRLALLVGAVAAAGLVAGWWVLLAGSELQGELRSEERTTLRLGRRAVVVAEAGTAFSYRVRRSGAARVVQSAGNAFYRVEPGGPFEVETPAGLVQVLGTCFRVEVHPMKAHRAGLAGAAAGAALATVVVVSVYEGKVLTASPRGSLRLAAGEVGKLDGTRAPERLDGEAAAINNAARGGATAGVRRNDAPPGSLVEQHQRLAGEAERLRAQVKTLEGQLQQAKGPGKDPYRAFDLSKEELVGMAKKCELRWDTPPLGAEPSTASEETVRELGLTDQEKAAVNQVFAGNHRRTLQDLRKLYVEVTGDAKGSDTLSPRALMEEIDDKSTKQELKQVFQKLARERAGLQAPPAELSGTTALERLYRLLTSMGDRVERELGGQIGPDLARRYRELRGGFGSRSRSSNGCP
ncbi:MAG: FecR domain-containing protein [Deltaproteobacteria bacterium]|nr:FecR domain-containing protein [Deltaproteobacteria bacterium]